MPSMPVGLMGHTMTAVDKWLYIVGGLTSEQALSSKIYRYDTLSGEGKLWFIIFSCFTMIILLIVMLLIILLI